MRSGDCRSKRLGLAMDDTSGGFLEKDQADHHPVVPEEAGFPERCHRFILKKFTI